ncbi:hypothetical protein [Paenibacillus hunanensis]|uniref:Uncharacterized protein n=1 Tax=Paenibacillus hunanensis TaxID=539262 RepID=A0ABU1J5H1_9BACL|nr:hypothetical protein [Paenibacillus hunanensis]MDR6246745.1 hypothetical protein [Paenibacillus hunanensis]GGJ23269.1 hypothetical protein GCM10008022_35280 [Paenibacillus hunanensis]
MIDFLKNKEMHAYNQLMAVAERPDFLFSNDSSQYHAEANYNMYTIQKLNKLIKNNNISITELEQIFNFIEHSWTVYLSTYFTSKSFIFYAWGDYQIPALRLSVVSFHEDLELPFRCALDKTDYLAQVMTSYYEELQLDQNVIAKAGCNEIQIESSYLLTVYSKVIRC